MRVHYKIYPLINGEMYSSLSHILLNQALALNLPKEQVVPFNWEESIPLEDGSFTPGVMCPIIVWLLVGPYGPILVDTGMPDPGEARRIITAQGGEMKPSFQDPEWKLESQLARHGFKPDDIERIIISHLHGDHYGNNGLFPKARFYIHKDEIPLCLAAPPWSPFYRPGFKRYLLEVIDQVQLVDGDMQLCEGVRMVHVGGHSPGLLSVVVDTEIGRVAIASDIIHSYRNLELNWPIGSYWDLNQVIRGMRHLLEIADLILPNHDAELWKRFPQGVIG